MKVAVLGATGWIGSTIVQQATKRGLEVVSIVRDAAKITDNTTAVRVFDLQSQDNIASVLKGIDVLIASVGGRAVGNHELVAQTAERLLTALNGTSTRLIWVGGAGSLEVAPGVTLVSTPEFPADYKDEALAQGEALNVFKTTTSSASWTFVSPAAVIYPGESEGPYRIGGDQFFTNEAGESKVSVTDYAIALVDEAQKAAHLNQRISVAY
ncbi:NAD(P)-dependent oxidoreductase [Pseudoalteromonas fuliginea]|uniref:NAD(P)-dependent oxidoreductase n=1 Tax=Pseudoalteromonas fuliginea TaxID=1872678 RepID=A0AB73BM33_9GAMM|nr:MULTISPECIES: NAD(P)-dependent oxidoreductase [Pseudoalteromonas]ALQ09860.1 NAD-dependent dehydratase [Pseudoalteromonas sp. Bsw20308]KAA1165759.1 NAD(P)-dependent oxidoreductase [Pseudoalteromonas fuliginea]KDC49933.1 NAD-dependent dehydratase [Pseudoalteromonas fuliginea]KJZ27335.1 NAD-dependent dehydratase [Pseudoalteromonas fuliginea]